MASYAKAPAEAPAWPSARAARVPLALLALLALLAPAGGVGCGRRARAERLAAHGHRTCVLLAGGDRRCWGRVEGLRLGDNGVAVTRPADDNAGFERYEHTTADCASVRGGGVRCTAPWASRFGFGATSALNELRDVVDLASADGAVCAVLRGGLVSCAEVNESGRLGSAGEPTQGPRAVERLADATRVAVGSGHACATRADGSVWCWGRNDHGQLGRATGVCDSGPKRGPCDPLAGPVPGLGGAVQVAVSDASSCALLRDGSVVCWGDALRERTTPAPPAPVRGLAGATQIASGGAHFCARLADGTARCWGLAPEGALGYRPPRREGLREGLEFGDEARAVEGLGGVVAVAPGGGHACALLDGGDVRCWGGNGWGELGDGTKASRPTPAPVRW